MVTAKQIINSIKPKKISQSYKTPLGEVGYDNPRDDIERVKKMREGLCEKVPALDNDIVNKKYIDDLNLPTTYLKLDTSNDPLTNDLTLDDGTGISPKLILNTNELGASGKNYIEVNDLDRLELHAYTSFNFIVEKSVASFEVPFYNQSLANRPGDAIFKLYGSGVDANAWVSFMHRGDADNGVWDTGVGGTEFVADSYGFTFIPIDRGNITLNIHDSEQVAVGNVTPTNLFSVNEKSSMSPIGGFCIMLTNKTGVNSVAGDVVIAHTTVNDAVAWAAGGELQPIGVFLESGVADGSEAWIVVSGIADVHMDAGGASNGDRIVTSATARRGLVNNAPAVAVHFQEIGHCIETVAGNGTGRCVLHFL